MGMLIKKEFVVEAKKQLRLSVPLVVVNLLLSSIQIISLMFVGHLGQLPLSTASLAISFTTVTCFSVLMGMGTALETQCGQAFGADQHRMLGVYTQRAIMILVVLSVALSFILYNTGFILVGFHQDHEIAHGAGEFNRWMIPAIFAYAILQCFIRFLQAQKIVVPMMIFSGITTMSHAFLCWLLVYKIKLGSKGAAIANSLSYWFNVVLLALYIKFSTACSQTFRGFSREAFTDIPKFMKIGVPSALMICLEFWSFNAVVFLSGLLPNPKLETSTLSISLSTCSMVYTISMGLSGAVSTIVSNELGAGNSQQARFAVIVAAIISIAVGLIVATITILVRNVWGKLYSNDTHVIQYLAKILLLLALSDFFDGVQCVLSRVARGCGWQTFCALINLGAYYAVGIPSAAILAFVFHKGGMGLWTGIICGLSIQVLALIIAILRTDWDKEVMKARDRVQATQTSQATRAQDIELRTVYVS